MYIIKQNANENGSRPPIQTWSSNTLPKGYVVCPDEFINVFYSTTPAGFVNITIENNTVTSMEVNQEALNAYIASLPEPEPVVHKPTVEERVENLEDALAQTDETAIALYEAQAAQEEINAAQDAALIEIYEMIGG